MSTSIDTAFIKMYDSDVHLAYQQMGSKLRGTCRTKTQVRGQDVTFQKVGTGTAAAKSRHGLVPTMNQAHTTALCTMADSYAADWVDKFDELKINIDERMAVAQGAAGALGRKTDYDIITVLDANATTTVAHGSTGLTRTKVLDGFKAINDNDVPDDGLRYWVVGPKQWNELLTITEFASGDYVGGDDLPWLRGTQAKRWLNILFFMSTQLNVASSIRETHLYHRSAVGHGIAADVTTEVTYHGDRASYFVNSMMSQGAVLIDARGAVSVSCSEA